MAPEEPGREIQEYARSGDPRAFLDRLFERVGSSATVKNVFGDPIEHGGTTIVPVARVRFGFGGGGGREAEKREGAGGGGGAQVAPVGFLEYRDGRVKYRKIRYTPPFARVLAIGIIAWLAFKLAPSPLRRWRASRK